MCLSRRGWWSRESVAARSFTLKLYLVPNRGYRPIREGCGFSRGDACISAARSALKRRGSSPHQPARAMWRRSLMASAIATPRPPSGRSRTGISRDCTARCLKRCHRDQNPCLRSATRFHNYLNRFGDVESTPESAGLEFAPRLLIPSGFQDPPSTVPNS